MTDMQIAAMRHYYNDIDSYCCKVLHKNITLGNLPEGGVDERDIRDIHAADLVGYDHISLFAGIGGIPLGLMRSGLYDIPGLRTLDGGFPCQDISNAGKRAGIGGERSGLWKEMVRLIQESLDCGRGFDIIVLENVSVLTSRGLDTVLIDLAQSGYDAQWTCLRASDVGVPHVRERIFIVAYPHQFRESGSQSNITGGQRGTPLSAGVCERENRAQVADIPLIGSDPRRPESARQQRTSNTFSNGTLADATSTRLPLRGCAGLTSDDTQAGAGMEHQSQRRRETLVNARCAGQQERNTASEPGSEGLATWGYAENGHTGQSQSLFCRGADGLSGWLDRYRWPVGPGQEQEAWEPPRVTAEKVPHRVARLKALGNAVVPQCAEYVGRCIMAALAAESQVPA